MGDKGARDQPAGAAAAERLVADLAALGDVRTKKMFGGYGVFHEDAMFGIVDSQGTVFLRADARSLSRFEDAESEKHSRMPYWSVPAAVLDDEEDLEKWAREAVQTARASKT